MAVRVGGASAARSVEFVKGETGKVLWTAASSVEFVKTTSFIDFGKENVSAIATFQDL